MVEADSVGVIVAFVDGEVKVVGAVDLDVEEAGARNARGVSTIARTGSPRARGSGGVRACGPRWEGKCGRVYAPEDVPAEVDDPVRPFFAEEEGALGVEDDAAALVDPEVLLDERAVLLREEAVREADEAVGGGHGGVVGRQGGGWAKGERGQSRSEPRRARRLL